MNRNLTLTVVAISIVIFYVLTESPIVLAFVTVFSLVLMIPPSWFKRLTGYVVLADVLTSAYLFQKFLGTGTLGAVPIAAFSAFFVSVALRIMRLKLGAERLAINGSTDFRTVFPEIASHLISWCKAIAKGVTSGKIVAPSPLNFEWVEVDPPHSWGYILRSLVAEPVTA